MELVYDADKEEKNKRLHRISLTRAKEFDFLTARILIDDREDYGEVRYRALGFLDARLHVFVFTEPQEGVIRAISLRKANREERIEYAAD